MDSFTTGARWSWPEGMQPRDTASRNDASSSGHAQADDGTQTSRHATPEPEPAQPRRRHYNPRTCRICLEVVQPATELDDSIAAGLFNSKARVRYVSEDPELGRLISPCLCKGSQKYVHEGCLQAWRQAAPLSDRNFWQCPTCKFEYRLSRLRYGRWLPSKLLRAGLTLLVLLVTVFFLGFVADPIINFWVDPLGTVADTFSDTLDDIDATGLYEGYDDDELDGWWFHFVKGFLSLGLLGVLKTFFASSWTWFFRIGGGRRRGRGRDRMEDINLALVIIGIATFLGVSPYFCLLKLTVD